LAGRMVDRPPVGAWGHSYLDEWSPERLAAVTVDRARRLGWDYIKFQPRATFFAEAFGARYRPSGSPEEAPVCDHTPLGEGDSWERLTLSDFGVMEQQARTLGRVVGELGETVPVLQTVFSPMSVAAYLVGRDRDRLVASLRARPEVVGTALNRIADALVEFVVTSVQEGAAGIFYAISGFATPEAMPFEVYRDLLLPLDRRVLRNVPRQAWFNVLHLCGPHQYLELAAQLPVQVLSYSVFDEGNPSLAEARRQTGRAVMGGVEQRRLLVNGAASEIAAQVRDAVRSLPRGLLVGPGCSVPPTAPEANLMAMRDAVGAAASAGAGDGP
jgi:uroporphyrinogen decarboxylase